MGCWRYLAQNLKQWYSGEHFVRTKMVVVNNVFQRVTEYVKLHILYLRMKSRGFTALKGNGNNISLS